MVSERERDDILVLERGDTEGPWERARGGVFGS